MELTGKRCVAVDTACHPHASRRPHRQLRSLGVVLLLILSTLLTACEEQATPFPVDIPVTPTPTPIPTAIPPVRYALAANTIGFVPVLDRIRETAEVLQLDEPTVNPAELGTRFDIIAAYGEYPEWTRSPVTPHVMLVTNPDTAPLDVQLAFILRAAPDPAEVIATLAIPGLMPVDPPENFIPLTPAQLRTELANLGRPDGLRLKLGHVAVPGVDVLVTQFAAANVETRLTAGTNESLREALESGAVQMALITWHTEAERTAWVDLFGLENVRELYSLPISYLALPELSIEITGSGWPVATR